MLRMDARAHSSHLARIPTHGKSPKSRVLPHSLTFPILTRYQSSLCTMKKQKKNKSKKRLRLPDRKRVTRWIADTMDRNAIGAFAFVALVLLVVVFAVSLSLSLT